MIADRPSQDAAGAAPDVNNLDILSSGVRWRYQKTGSGPTLLLVHGLLGYSFSWRNCLPAVAQHFTVYAVDLPGTGYSERPRHLDCCLRTSAERLLRFMDDVGIATCDLLGTSHGGALAITAAALAPARFGRLVLVAPANPWSPRGKFLSVLLTSWPVQPMFLAAFPHLSFVHEHYFRRLYGDPRRISPGTFEGYRAALEQERTFDYALNIMRTWNPDMQSVKESLPKIADIPTLLIWGDRDTAVSPASMKPLQQSLHNCRVLVMPGIGHLPYEEAPEEFVRAVAQFLNIQAN